MRYTNLDFEKIIKELDNPDGYFSKHFLHREIGNILLETETTEAEKAEAFFRDILDSNKPDDDKVMALRHLLALDCMDEKTWKKLKEFPKRSFKNKSIYLRTGESII